MLPERGKPGPKITWDSAGPKFKKRQNEWKVTEVGMAVALGDGAAMEGLEGACLWAGNVPSLDPGGGSTSVGTGKNLLEGALGVVPG